MSTVWIVDDSPLERTLAHRALGSSYDVRVFNDGTSVVEALSRGELPDALVLDNALPGLTGVEVTRFLRARKGPMELPILILSGTHAASDDVVEGLRAGANDYLLKPYASAVLLARVDGLVEVQRARERAARAERSLRRLLEHLPDPFLAVDRVGCLSFINAAAQRMLGRAASALEGRPLAEELPALASLAGAVEGARLHDVTFGDRIYSPVLGRLVIDERLGETLTITLRDVTDKAQAILQRDRFLATLAHELRNPLAPILSAMQLVQLQPHDAKVQERARVIVHRQVERLIRIVDDLLDVSRVSRGRVEVNIQPVDVAEAVARAIESAEPSLKARRHRVLWDPPSTPLAVMADPLRLEQMLSNLLHNASKYSQPGSRIWIAATSTDGQVTLSVRDEGIGIAPAMQRAIFEMFVQVDDSLHRSEGGLGIGLPLVRQLAALQGGDVTVESGGLGRGSVFTVRLPAARVAPAPEAAAPLRAVASRPLRVHVVDDNADAAELLHAALELAGHQVHVTYHGGTAVEDAVAFAPDVVLLDIGLPGRDGYEVARDLRSDPRLAQAMLVAVTGYGQPEDIERARRSGFDAHIVKPVSFESLDRILAAAARR